MFKLPNSISDSSATKRKEKSNILKNYVLSHFHSLHALILSEDYSTNKNQKKTVRFFQLSFPNIPLLTLCS